MSKKVEIEYLENPTKTELKWCRNIVQTSNVLYTTIIFGNRMIPIKAVFYSNAVGINLNKTP